MVKGTTRLWSGTTHEKYVKKNILLGFVQEIGDDSSSSIAESIMEHAIDDGDAIVETGADQTGLAIVADKVIRHTRQRDDSLDDDDDDDDSEEED